MTFKKNFLSNQGVQDDLTFNRKSSEDIVYTPDQEKLLRLYQSVLLAQDSGTSRQKGCALENFVVELFSSVAGWSCVRRNVRTSSNEIDCVFRNANIVHPLLREMGTMILAECKCQKKQCSSKDIQVFDNIIKESRASYGFLVTTSGITGSKFRSHQLNDALKAINNAFKEGRHLIWLDGEDIKNLSRGGDLIETVWARIEDIRLL